MRLSGISGPLQQLPENSLSIPQRVDIAVPWSWRWSAPSSSAISLACGPRRLHHRGPEMEVGQVGGTLCNMRPPPNARVDICVKAADKNTR